MGERTSRKPIAYYQKVPLSISESARFCVDDDDSRSKAFVLPIVSTQEWNYPPPGPGCGHIVCSNGIRGSMDIPHGNRVGLYH